MSVWVEFSYMTDTEYRAINAVHENRRTGMQNYFLIDLDHPRATILHATIIAAKNHLLKQDTDWHVLIDAVAHSPYCTGPDTVLYKNDRKGFTILFNDNRAYQASAKTLSKTENLTNWLDQAADAANTKGLISLRDFLRNQANGHTRGGSVQRLVTNVGSGASGLANAMSQ